LARHLGRDQPVYGLQAQGLDGKHPCHERVEDMAEHYIQEVRSVQPVGPYHLGGLSFGGVVAFEMARQLHAQGQQVALVALFDAWTTNYKPKVSRTTKFLLLPTRLKLQYLLRKVGNEFAILRRKTSLLLLPQGLKDVRKACGKAANRYVPASYAGRVVLFRARDQALFGSDDPFLGWDNLTLGGVEVREIIGDHVSIVNEPYVANLATELATCLERSRDAQVSNRSLRETVLPRSKPSGPRQSSSVTGGGSKIVSGS
jgi:thioesterase domain-containing protein